MERTWRNMMTETNFREDNVRMLAEGQSSLRLYDAGAQRMMSPVIAPSQISPAQALWSANRFCHLANMWTCALVRHAFGSRALDAD